jgi:phosphoglycolate phosphatase
MKADVFDLLIQHNILDRQFPLHEHTIATLLQACKATGVLSETVEKLMWDRVAAWERAGMQDAGLESGATDLLDALTNQYRLVILTNNARQAAIEALEHTGVTHYFDRILGREQMDALKPSPSGIHNIMSYYPQIVRQEWLSVGDAWIDGKAAQEAGVDFLGYCTKEEEFIQRGIPSIGRLHTLMDLLVHLE